MTRNLGAGKLTILGDALGEVGGIIRDGDGELQLVGLAEALAPGQERGGILDVVGAGELIETVDKDVGNIEVTGMQAADKALEEYVAADIILAGVDQTNAVVNVKSQGAALLDADHAARFRLDGCVDSVDQLLGLTGTLKTHNYLNHRKDLLKCREGEG